MADHNGKDDMQQGFCQKAGKLASSKTPAQKKAAVKKGFKVFDRLAAEAEANGLTDEILADILAEIDDEREQERLAALKGKPDA